MLQTIRDYARELLESEGDYVTTAKAHAQWFTSLLSKHADALWRAVFLSTISWMNSEQHSTT